MARIAITLVALATASISLHAQDAAKQATAAPAPAPAQAAEKQDPKPATPAAAQAMTPEQQAMMDAWMKASTPGAQHKQLADQFAGTWTTKQTMWMDPSAPPMNETGKSVNAAEYGGRHVRSKFTGTWMGQPFQGEAITSYDNTKGKYVNLWVDSMGTGQYVTEGDYDPATKTYTFTGTMSDPTKPDRKTTMRDTIRFADADHYTMESYELKDGKQQKMMQIEYTRAAP